MQILVRTKLGAVLTANLRSACLAIVAIAMCCEPALGRTYGKVGGLSATVTAAPAAFDYRRTPRMDYALTFSTGPNEERFAVAVDPPTFPPAEGSPFAGLIGGRLALSGPARLGYRRDEIPAILCSTYNVIHGAEPAGYLQDVIAPPWSTSTLRISFVVWRRDAPFPGQDIRPRFRLTPELVSPRDDGVGTIPGTLTLRPPRLRIGGRTGVRLWLRTSPRTVLYGSQSVPTYRPGRAIKVSGTTAPVLRRQVIQLRVKNRLTGLGPDLLARVRTNARGRFTYRWRLRTTGTNELFAFYKRQQRAVTSDRACPRIVRVRR